MSIYGSMLLLLKRVKQKYSSRYHVLKRNTLCSQEYLGTCTPSDAHESLHFRLGKLCVYRSLYSALCMVACPFVWQLFIDLVWGIDWWAGQLQLLVIHQIVQHEAQGITIWWKGLIQSPHATSGCWISVFLLLSSSSFAFCWLLDY